MHDIDMQAMSREFFQCWRSAGMHLGRQIDEVPNFWLRAHPNPPFLEHLSFRLGNQLFFVRVEDIDRKVEGPGSLRGLDMIATGSNGHACLLPMRKRAFGEDWEPVHPGWGLISARTGRAVDPFHLVSDAPVPMSDWEVHDMAVQVVRGHIEAQGLQLMSWQGNPDVDPSIWFVSERGQPAWVVVRAVRYPAHRAAVPPNWADIAQSCARMSREGRFASVALAHADQEDPANQARVLPLLRGQGMYVNFEGLERVDSRGGVIGA